MSWAFVAVGAVAGGTAFQSFSASNKEVAAGARASIQQNNQITAQNEASVEANLKNTIRTGYRVGILNVQQGQMNREAIQKGFDISAAQVNALGSADANQAAVGAIGASAQAVLNDVRMRAGEAQAQNLEDWQIQKFNFNTQLADLVFQGTSALTGSQAATEFDAPSVGESLTSALVQGAIAGGTMYATSKFKLGAGAGGGTK
jgi:hypothetical protein